MSTKLEFLYSIFLICIGSYSVHDLDLLCRLGLFEIPGDT